MIAVVDYGMGNLRSVAKALAHVAPQAQITVTSDASVILSADRIVLPGQSAMPDTMAALEDSGLRDTVLACLRDRPFLGVCLGLQMLFETSEEGPTRCLGTLAGEVRRFREEELALPGGERLKVPHMGWSPVAQARRHPLFDGIAD
ncbi:MAG TPA: imidazole glycerol phosphate synthase subunit HisH, partial [Casimicrobiaceae bacterium]|nr:imidazole glycerol phosphate synthase subunit HisH [Casimicrobiaceae bacterium]